MRQRISKIACGLTVYAVVIILWGAWVRISGSGDGCGTHWPLCQGSFLPDQLFKSAQTLIEFLHRIKSGLFGLLVMALWFIVVRSLVFSRFEKRIASLAMFFTVSEALLGARLVLAGLVGQDASTSRAVTVGLHLLNTLFLVMSLVALWNTTRQPDAVGRITLHRKDWLIVFVFLSTAAFGAVAALSSTLFPTLSLYEGFKQDAAAASPWYVTVRIFHPILALALIVTAIRWASSCKEKNITTTLLVIIGTAVFGMAALVVLPRPAWMKLTHLLLANVSWILLIRSIVENRLRSQAVVNIAEMQNTLISDKELERNP